MGAGERQAAPSLQEAPGLAAEHSERRPRLLREGEDVPYSCRGGTCHTCRLRATSGDLPEESQRGLKETQRAQGYFLACSCHPKTDLEIESEPDSLPFQGRVQEHDEIGEDIVRLRLRLDDELGYAPGQFVNLGFSPFHAHVTYQLQRPEGETGTYSATIRFTVRAATT